tara:strand:- start:164 stop:280 length:117 start_codon:yes stop_codon:yes gene_type:complete
MPVVNGKHYAYSRSGVSAAKKAAKKSGKKMTMKRKKKY